MLVSAKDKYTNENNQTINKEQAGNDFDVLQKRLKNGEEMKIIEERITEGKYSVALPYNVYTFQLRDLKINKDRAGDIYNRLCIAYIIPITIVIIKLLSVFISENIALI